MSKLLFIRNIADTVIDHFQDKKFIRQQNRSSEIPLTGKSSRLATTDYTKQDRLEKRLLLTTGIRESFKDLIEKRRNVREDRKAEKELRKNRW